MQGGDLIRHCDRFRCRNRLRSGALSLLIDRFRGSPFYRRLEKTKDFPVRVDGQRFDELAAPENFRHFRRRSTGLEQTL
jgi:hypothetical protein